MTLIDVNDFNQELDCVYAGEHYGVRDNGAVMRFPHDGRRPRPKDNQWTFGKPNENTGYMEIVTVRVHRVVATAFHGNPPTSEHVVDHIDTNRRNNRPENLRWLTRLENALCNPITVRRIELICGSIEAFLADPSKLFDSSFDRNFEWMRAVTLEEAQTCLERMHLWAKSNKSSSGGAIGEWVFDPASSQNPLSLKGLKNSWQTTEILDVTKSKFYVPPTEPPVRNKLFEAPQERQVYSEASLVIAKTPNAAQRNWRTPSEFPCCPQSETDVSILAYVENLKVGAVFSKNHFSEHIVLETAIALESASLWVMCENKDGLKPWSLAKVTYEDSLFVHESLGQFFGEDGAKQALCLAQGLEWTGGPTFDEFAN